MNKWIGCGRLTRDPEIRYSNGNNGQTCVARYSLAIDRPGKDNGTDFINCVAFGRSGEFAEKYLRKGMKMIVEGRIQTGSYTDRDGKKVYTTDVVVSNHEFAESKNAQPQEHKYYDSRDEIPVDDGSDFMIIGEDMGDEIPFV